MVGVLRSDNITRTLSFFLSLIGHGFLIAIFFITTSHTITPVGTVSIIHAYIDFDSGLLTKKMNSQNNGNQTSSKHPNKMVPQNGTKGTQQNDHDKKDADRKHHENSTSDEKKEWSSKKDNKKVQTIRYGKNDPLLILIHNLIREHQHYPRAAQILGKEGDVNLAFTLSPNGQIRHIVILHSSGNTSLDNAAYYAVQAIHPIAIANRYLQQEKTLTVWVHFKIQHSR